MKAGQDEKKEPRLRRPKLQRDSVPRSLSAADGNNSIDMAIRRLSSRSNPNGPSKIADSTLASVNGVSTMRGMVLPFTPLAMSFDKVNYYVDMPAEMKAQGVPEDKLQLLWEVTGASYGSLFARIFGYCEQNDIHSPKLLSKNP